MEDRIRYLQVRMYEGERKGLFGPPMYQRIVQEVCRQGLCGVTVSRADAGFDGRGRLQDIHSEYMSDNLPMLVEFVATETRINRVLDTVRNLMRRRLQAWYTDAVTDVKQLTADGPCKGAMREVSKCGVLKVYMNEHDRIHGNPLCDELLKQLRQQGVTWVNVMTALEGVGQEHVLRRNRNFSLTKQAPLVLEAVITSEVDVQTVLGVLAPCIAQASGPAIYLDGVSI